MSDDAEQIDMHNETHMLQMGWTAEYVEQIYLYGEVDEVGGHALSANTLLFLPTICKHGQFLILA